MPKNKRITFIYVSLSVSFKSHLFKFLEAMRLLADIKNDHFEPINFIQVSGTLTESTEKFLIDILMMCCSIPLYIH